MIPLPIDTNAMSANDIIVIEQLFTQRKNSLDPASTDAAFWEFFTAEQILRDYSFDPDEIKSGIVGQETQKAKAGTDGGIDSIYLIVNNRLIRDLDQAKALSGHKGNVQFDIIVIQSKKVKGFDLATLVRLNNTSESIFDIGKNSANFGERYNSPLVEIIDCFREAHTALLPLSPRICVHFYIASIGDPSNIDANIKGKATELVEKTKKILSTVDDCQVEFLGARQLVAIVRKPTKSAFHLKCVSSLSDNKGGFVALVELEEYFKLITENGQLREHLFESNVRDFEGDVTVNKQIKETLENPHKDIDFWWLNNGITIIVDAVGGHPPTLMLHEPQIVNGLQTSKVIFDCLSQPLLSNASPPPPPRHVILRIISSANTAAQDKIIRATNSQTKIPPQYLWASDTRQRDIEDIFKARGLHYDRRKNSWRRTNRLLADIFGPSELAQSVAAILLQEPDHARARPARYAKQPFRQKVFKANIPLQTYVVCAQIRRRVESFLVSKEPDKTHRNNLLFYVMMALAALLVGVNSASKASKLKDLDVAGIADSDLDKALKIVRPIYAKLGESDKAAKGPSLVAELKSALANLATKGLASKKQTA